MSASTDQSISSARRGARLRRRLHAGTAWRAWALALAVPLLLQGCAETNPNAAPEATMATPLLPRPGRSAAAVPAPAASGPAALTSSALVHHGTGVVVEAAVPPTTVGATSSDGQPGDITLNFVDADVREVLRSVLGDLLHLNYAIDSKVQATVTVQTSRPLKPADVLPVLAQVLRASGLTLVEANGIYRVTPSEDAQRAGGLPVIVGSGGPAAAATYDVQILPLKYASASEMQTTIEPFLPKGATVKADPTRNLLLLSGSAQDLGTVVEMVRSFDVDWLAGMSYAIIPLHTGSAKTVVTELGDIFGANGSIPLPGLLRFAPLDRMDAVLVVSPQRNYIDQARQWIERLDRGADESSPHIYEYHVQNSRAADVAKVLSALFSSSQVRTVQPQTAPGTDMTQIGGLGSANGTGGTGSALGGSGLGTSSLTPSQGSLAGGTTGQSPLGATGTLGTPGTTAQPAIGTGPGPGQTQDNSQSASQQGGGPSNPFEQAGANQGGLQLPPVRIVADEKTNTLAIYAKPRDFRMIADALEKIDIVPLQVLIEATIAEVTLSNDLQYGLQYFFNQQHQNQASFLANLPTGTVPPVPLTFPGFNYVFAGTNSNVVLNLLSSITNLHVISSPELLVLDHQVASLVVGDEVPIPTAQTTYATTSVPVTSNTIQYVDTGVVLHVSPRVNANGLITLEISQEVSSVASTPAVNTPAGAPTIQQRRIQSTITVQDGETIALGGLITDTKSNNHNGIPLLSDIPVVGALFRSTEVTSARTELLILLSPKVLHNPREAREATDELKSRLHALQPAAVPEH